MVCRDWWVVCRKGWLHICQHIPQRVQRGRGVVCADFDNDGDVDLLLLHRNETNAVTLWENRLRENVDYLGVVLRGAAPNTNAVGARITVSVAGTQQMREVSLGSNFASHNDTRQLFGLGATSTVDWVRVEWPNGQQSEFTNVPANQYLEIVHPKR